MVGGCATLQWCASGLMVVRGKPGDFDAEFALDEAMLWEFLKSTQGKARRLLQSVGHCNIMA